MRTKKILKSGGSWWKISGEQKSCSVEEINNNFYLEDTSEKQREVMRTEKNQKRGKEVGKIFREK